MPIRAHDEAGYRRLGRLVAGAEKFADGEIYSAYETELQAALSKRATNKKHANVLQHALGYMKTVLDALEKREILSAIEDHRSGLLPLIVPLTLLPYNIRRHQLDNLAGQLFFDPHPKELMLRNHA